MSIFGNFFNGDNDEILFFILVFLLIFNGSLFGKGCDGGFLDDNSAILFFIIVFLLLFFNSDYGYGYNAK
ncbi:MAG: hypothetical protein N3B21_03815 [Clostridia bacterium]|nr:hypothetical protein [Clostridia bacterium]